MIDFDNLTDEEIKEIYDDMIADDEILRAKSEIE